MASRRGAQLDCCAGQTDGEHRLAGAGWSENKMSPASSRKRSVASSRMSLSSMPGWAVKSKSVKTRVRAGRQIAAARPVGGVR